MRRTPFPLSGSPFALMGFMVAILAVSNLTQGQQADPPATPSAELMTFEEYVRIKHDVPYILELSTAKGALLYFGSRHTYDPGDPQVRQIEALWRGFRPDVALFEGGNPEDRNPWVTKDKREMREFGEPGLVVFLATRDNVPVRTFEPARGDEAAFLRRTFSLEQIKLFYVLRQVPQFRQSQQDDSIENMANHMLEWLSHMPSLEGAPRNLPEFEASYARLFPGGPNWRQAPQSWSDPAAIRSATYTNHLAAKLARFRDQHIIQVLVEEVNRGQRVFAVVGASHVVMQEPVLRARLGVHKHQAPLRPLALNKFAPG
jgi:hypothetical protein